MVDAEEYVSIHWEIRFTTVKNRKRFWNECLNLFQHTVSIIFGDERCVLRWREVAVDFCALFSDCLSGSCAESHFISKRTSHEDIAVGIGGDILDCGTKAYGYSPFCHACFVILHDVAFKVIGRKSYVAESGVDVEITGSNHIAVSIDSHGRVVGNLVSRTEKCGRSIPYLVERGRGGKSTIRYAASNGRK